MVASSHPSSLLAQLASTALLDEAYDGLCAARRDAWHNHSIWDLRRHWPRRWAQLQQRLLNQTFESGPCRSVFIGGQCLSCWDAEDSIVQKVLAILLTPLLAPTISRSCYHLAGRGGMKAAVQRIHKTVPTVRFVAKSDIKSYYSTMDHEVLLSILDQKLANLEIRRVVESYLTHVTDWRGEIEINALGIAKGSPLSPLLGGLYVSPLDDVLESARPNPTWHYVRYMDDWVVLTRSRYVLRTLIRKMNRVLETLRVIKHPAKTFIGKISKGLIFWALGLESLMGYPLSMTGGRYL